MCEWKDGKLNPCEKLKRSPSISRLDELTLIEKVIIDFCPFCGADIRKPKLTRKTGVFIVNGEKFEFEYDIKAGDLAKMITEKTGLEAGRG